MFEFIMQAFDITTVLFVAVFFLLLGYRPPWWYYHHQPTLNKKVRRVGEIPGPLSVPILGTAWMFYIGGYNFNQIHLYFEDLGRKYGKIVKEEAFGNIPVINIFEKDDIKKVLKSGGKYPLRPPCEAVSMYRRSRPDRYTTIGLINEQGEDWYKLRSALTPTLTSPKTISSFLPQVQQIADDWSYLIRKLRNNENVVENLESSVDRLALELTCALVLGRRMGFLIPGDQSETAEKLAEAVREHFLATRDTYFGLPLWKWFNTSAYRRLKNCEETIYDLAVKLIETADESTKESAVYQSVLHADIAEPEKVAAIVDFISAGIHTMKNTFVFLLCLVAQNPKVQEKILKDETKQYVKACMTESFRLYPTAGSLARITEEDLELGGFPIKAGSVVVCHTGIAGRDERNFPKANEFRPERWINEDEKNDSTNNALFLLTPFGAGRRICPGKRFIENILPILLDYTVQNFDLFMFKELEVQFEFLLAPKGDISMRFLDRN